MLEFDNLISLDEVDNYDNPSIFAHFFFGDYHWYVLAGDKQEDGDWLLFCFVDLFCKELGYVTLGELLDIGAVLDTDWDCSIGLDSVMV